MPATFDAFFSQATSHAPYDYQRRLACGEPSQISNSSSATRESVLCTDKDQTKVEYATGGLDHQLFISRYLVALPKPEELQRLIETDRAAWEQNHP